MKIFTASASGKCLLVVFAILIAGLSVQVLAQDDPRVDTPVRPEGFVPSPRSGATSVDVITTPDGYDNFDLGTTNAEPHLSTNPLNPLWFFTAFNPTGSFQSWHTENGVTWTTNNPAWPSNAGDPVSAYDSLGNLYYEVMKSPITGCWVARSTNNGQTWGSAVTSVAGNDKNWIAADQTAGPFANYIYTTMTSSGSGNFARSTDLGATWTTTRNFSTQALPGMMVAVGPNVLSPTDTSGGCVYVVTHSGTNAAGIYTFYVSKDGGQTFTLKSTNQFSNLIGTEISGRSTVQGMRCRPYPMIAADNSFGPMRGRFYLVYASNNPAGNGNKSDIFLRYSTDQGENWSTPRIVNDDVNSQNNFQFHPAIWCDKETGRLYIKFYDTRRIPTSDSMDVYATYTDDGGETFAPNQRLTNRSFRINISGATGPTYRGDYDAITSNRYASMAVWTDFRNAPSPNYLGMTAYFPDFAMLVAPTNIFLNLTDSTNVTVRVPSVKLYSDVARFTASVSPSAPFEFSWLNGRDSLTSYPDSLILKIKTNGVTAGTYTITVTGSGPNGTPVHRRTISVDVNTNLNTMTVTAPNGGENWLTGALRNITWVRTGTVDSVKLEYSTNNGASWTQITPGIPAIPSSYTWTVANTPTTQGRVRVSWTDSANVNDMSDAAFTISPSTFPIIFVAPDSIVASLELGSNTTTDTLRISNTGTAALTWALSESSTSPADAGELVYYTAGPQLPKGADDGMTIGAGIDGQGGPDGYGYRWIDSDEPGGPTFNWVDITGTGTALDSASAWIPTGTFRGGDEGYFPVALPFTFNYYGVDKDTLFIGTNGYCSFQAPTANAFTNTAFPTAGGPVDNILGAWWDDLEVRARGRVYYGTSAGNFVVQYDSIPLYNAAASNYTFQLILSPSGEWTYQYLSMGFSGGTLLSATIGMENAGGTIGLSVIHNAAYIHNNLAIKFGRGISWLSQDTTSGTISQGTTQNVVVTFNSTGLALGTYRGNLVITSNDPPRSPWTVPARLTVTDVVPVGEEENGATPLEFALMQNYPNPFNPTTTIRYALPKDAFVRLAVTNVLGQEVATLQEGVQTVGFHDVIWNGTSRTGRNVASGVYFYRIEAKAADGTQTYTTMNKMLMLK
jgi:hypothetical protein